MRRWNNVLQTLVLTESVLPFTRKVHLFRHSVLCMLATNADVAADELRQRKPSISGNEDVCTVHFSFRCQSRAIITAARGRARKTLSTSSVYFDTSDERASGRRLL